jgi:hypothetical protein
MVAGGARERLGDLMRQLEDGNGLEVAGYRLSPALAAGMQSLKLGDLRPSGIERVAWLEAAADAQRPLTPASQAIVDDWIGHGIAVSDAVVPCDAFWATQEIARCDELVDRVVSQLVADGA